MITGALAILWKFLKPLLPYLLIVAGLSVVVLYVGHLKDQITIANDTATKALNANTELKGTIDNMATVNQQSAAAVKDLIDQRAIDSKTLLGLQDLLYKIDKNATAQSAALNNLEKNNAQVNSYLNTPVPAELNELYFPTAKPGTPWGSKVGDPAGGPKNSASGVALPKATASGR